MQIFCLFFCVLYVIYCELGGKITQSMQVCLSKTSPPLNKSTFHIITALFARVGILFSPTLRFATHWAELTHPCGAVTVVCYQFSSSQLSANSQNNSTTQQSNNSTPEGHPILAGLKARFISAPFRKGGVLIPLFCFFEGCKPE